MSPCSSTSSSVATTENMSISLSPSSTNESDVYSANDSDIIEEVDEEAMDTSYNNPYSTLSIHAMVRSSPSGASSSSSSSSSPSGSNFVPNLYSPQKGPGINEGGSNNPPKPQQQGLQTSTSQYSSPLSLPPPHNGTYQTSFQGSTAPRPKQQIAPICYNKNSSRQEIRKHNVSMSRNPGLPGGLTQHNQPQVVQEERQNYQAMAWKKPNPTSMHPSQSMMGQQQNVYIGDAINQNGSKLPKTNFNLNGPVSRLYSDITTNKEQSIWTQRQQQQPSRPSIHESGLPSLQPKPSQTYSGNPIQMQARFSSLNFRNNNSNYQHLTTDQRTRVEGNNPYTSLSGIDLKNNHVAFHEYENYFYI